MYVGGGKEGSTRLHLARTWHGASDERSGFWSTGVCQASPAATIEATLLVDQGNELMGSLSLTRYNIACVFIKRQSVG